MGGANRRELTDCEYVGMMGRLSYVRKPLGTVLWNPMGILLPDEIREGTDTIMAWMFRWDRTVQA